MNNEEACFFQSVGHSNDARRLPSKPKITDLASNPTGNRAENEVRTEDHKEGKRLGGQWERDRLSTPLVQGNVTDPSKEGSGDGERSELGHFLT